MFDWFLSSSNSLYCLRFLDKRISETQYFICSGNQDEETLNDATARDDYSKEGRKLAYLVILS